MALFLYIAGTLISFILLAYFDVKGSQLFALRPRSELRGIELEMNGRLLFGSLACCLWPLTMMLLTISLFYRGLLYFFSRQAAKPQMWSCPNVKQATGYRDTVQRCSVVAKSVNRPKCKKHHCEMVREDLA